MSIHELLEILLDPDLRARRSAWACELTATSSGLDADTMVAVQVKFPDGQTTGLSVLVSPEDNCEVEAVATRRLIGYLRHHHTLRLSIARVRFAVRCALAVHKAQETW